MKWDFDKWDFLKTDSHEISSLILITNNVDYTEL